MPTVLLLGGRSFIGGHICRALIARGYHVLLHSRSSADFRNLSDIIPNAAVEPVVCGLDRHDELRALMDKCQFAVCAAIPYSKQSIGQRRAIHRDAQEFEATLAMLSASRIAKSVFVSVSGTIGRVAGGLADETRLAAHDPPTGWGHLVHKIAAEEMIGRYVRNGLRAVIVNPSMCVGAFDTKPSTGEFFKFFTRSPWSLMPEARLNIVDVEDVARGTILALEKGTVGQRYILSGTNTTMEVLIQRIRQLDEKPVPRLAIPRGMAVAAAYCSEVLNLILRRPAPLIPLLGVELIEQGSQHLDGSKAERELGYRPHDAWAAVDRAYSWYKQNNIL